MSIRRVRERGATAAGGVAGERATEGIHKEQCQLSSFTCLGDERHPRTTPPAAQQELQKVTEYSNQQHRRHCTFFTIVNVLTNVNTLSTTVNVLFDNRQHFDNHRQFSNLLHMFIII